jgi:hypothetical protein
MATLDWTANGKGLYVSADAPAGSILLHLDLQGKTSEVWHRLASTGKPAEYRRPTGGMTKQNQLTGSCLTRAWSYRAQRSLSSAFGGGVDLTRNCWPGMLASPGFRR